MKKKLRYRYIIDNIIFDNFHRGINKEIFTNFNIYIFAFNFIEQIIIYIFRNDDVSLVSFTCGYLSKGIPVISGVSK